MQLRCLYGAGAIEKKQQKKPHQNPDGKGMFMDVYPLPKQVWVFGKNEGRGRGPR